MNIFLTGGNGFLGRHLIPNLLDLGYKVIAPKSSECNLLTSNSLALYDGVKFDRIYHLAAWTQAGDFCLRHPGEQWINNQFINTNVLNWWKNSQPQAHLIFMGTSCSYAEDILMKETNYLLGKPIDSLYTYAMTKRMLLVGARALHKQFGLDYTCFIPSTLYGGNYHSDGRQMHFIFDLIRKIVNSTNTGSKAILWGDGLQRRELVHVKDFVRLMELTIPYVKNDLLNIGAGCDYSIRDFATTICEIISANSDLIEYDTTKYVGARSKCLNIDKLRSYQLDYEYTSLAEGLRDSIDWYISDITRKSC